NWLRMNDLFVLAELLDEFFDPVLVEKSFFFWRLVALVGQGDFETWIEKCELAQSGGKPLKLELGRDREDRGVGQKRDQSASRLFVFDLADNLELLRRFTAGKGHVIDLAVARDLHFEPIGKRVRAFCA